MEKTLSIFIDRLSQIFPDQLHSVYLYGSCVMDDFRPGWSDIDVLCLTTAPLSEVQKESLLCLRQSLCKEYGNPLFRAIEGVMMPLEGFLTSNSGPLVYWGTSGQRILNRYQMDPFSLYNVKHFGKCVYGKDIKSAFTDVSFPMLVDAIRFHLQTIRQHAQTTDDSLYSCGWMLDIARCLYTLRHQTIISKTKAGFWALEQHLCPEPHQMKQTLILRQTPSKRANDPSVKDWLRSLGPSVQRFADVLEKELMKSEPQ